MYVYHAIPSFCTIVCWCPLFYQQGCFICMYCQTQKGYYFCNYGVYNFILLTLLHRFILCSGKLHCSHLLYIENVISTGGFLAVTVFIASHVAAAASTSSATLWTCPRRPSQSISGRLFSGLSNPLGQGLAPFGLDSFKICMFPSPACLISCNTL